MIESLLHWLCFWHVICLAKVFTTHLIQCVAFYLLNNHIGRSIPWPYSNLFLARQCISCQFMGWECMWQPEIIWEGLSHLFFNSQLPITFFFLLLSISDIPQKLNRIEEEGSHWLFQLICGKHLKTEQTRIPGKDKCYPHQFIKKHFFFKPFFPSQALKKKLRSLCCSCYPLAFCTRCKCVALRCPGLCPSLSLMW